MLNWRCIVPSAVEQQLQESNITRSSLELQETNMGVQQETSGLKKLFLFSWPITTQFLAQLPLEVRELYFPCCWRAQTSSLVRALMALLMEERLFCKRVGLREAIFLGFEACSNQLLDSYKQRGWHAILSLWVLFMCEISSSLTRVTNA